MFLKTVNDLKDIDDELNIHKPVMSYLHSFIREHSLAEWSY